ncbi:MAG TPA: hypothetical protein VF622_04590 [Segetibacter sp.]
MEAKPLKKSEIDIVRKLSKGITVPEMATAMDKNRRSLETTVDSMSIPVASGSKWPSMACVLRW